MKHIAHRGYSAQYPENTMLAFEQSLVKGADMIELDVALTQDHTIVVIHDETVDRTTNGTGPVAGYMQRDLRALDAGIWKSKKFKSEPIPLLSEVLEHVGKEIALNIEIKAHAVHLNPDLSIEAPMHALLDRYRGLKDICISSFEPLALHRFKNLSPQFKRAYLVDSPMTEGQKEEMAYLEVDALHININNMALEDIEMAQSLGVKVRAFTVTSKAEYQKAKALDLDGVFINELDLNLLL